MVEILHFGRSPRGAAPAKKSYINLQHEIAPAVKAGALSLDKNN
jgi:hypothetical protein